MADTTPSPSAIADAPSETKGESVDLLTLIVAFGFQVIIASALLVVFSILRPTNKLIYAPRSKYAHPSKRPPPLPNLPAAWIRTVFRINERTLIPQIGLDAVLFLRFLRFALVFFVGLTCVGVPLCAFHFWADRITGDFDALNPSRNGTSTDEASGKVKFPNPNLTKLTMLRVHADSSWFWMYPALVCLFSGWAYFLLYKFWTEYVALRQQYYQTGDYQQAYHNKVLLLTDLPDDMLSTEKVADFMRRLKLKSPAKEVVIGRDLQDLPDMIKQHEQETQRLEKALAKYLENPSKTPSKRPTHKENAVLGICGGESVDTISVTGKKLHFLEDQIYELRSQPDSFFRAAPYAFVAFPSIQAAQSAARRLDTPAAVALRSNRLVVPSIKSAPDFTDIIWENVGMQPTTRKSRRLIAVSISAALILFWVAIVTFVSSIPNIDTLQRYAPALADWISQHKAASTILSGIIAPVLLAVMEIVPPIGFRIMARFQGVKSLTGVERSVMKKYFLFLGYQYAWIVVVAAGVAGVGSYLSGKKEGGLQDFTLFVVDETSKGFISKSTFFITMIVTGFTGVSIELLQIAPLLLTFLKRHILFLTPRQQHQFTQPPVFPYGAVLAQLVIKFILGMTYSIAAPIILPFAMLFWMMAYVVFKYQLCYVYEIRESGGGWWTTVFARVCVGVGVWQGLMGVAVLVLGMRSESGDKVRVETVAQSGLVFGMALVTGGFWWWWRRKFVESSSSAGAFVNATGGVSGNGKRTGNFGTNDTLYSNSNSTLGLGGQETDGEDELVVRTTPPFLSLPLWKVWVYKHARHILPDIYQPKYADDEDYNRRAAHIKLHDGYAKTSHGGHVAVPSATARLASTPTNNSTSTISTRMAPSSSSPTTTTTRQRHAHRNRASQLYLSQTPIRLSSRFDEIPPELVNTPVTFALPDDNDDEDDNAYGDNRYGLPTTTDRDGDARRRDSRARMVVYEDMELKDVRTVVDDGYAYGYGYADSHVSSSVAMAPPPPPASQWGTPRTSEPSERRWT
ncbi:hypothetical protein HDU85_004274 [Gaertneriomyces sp. JEL0708]|nr:hypothetical protein HDU85_004274 [Gaertneriomyces sp. JEL0708]